MYLAGAVDKLWTILTPDGKLYRARAPYAREAWAQACVPFAYAECRILRADLRVIAGRSRGKSKVRSRVEARTEA